MFNRLNFLSLLSTYQMEVTLEFTIKDYDFIVKKFGVSTQKNKVF